MHLFIYICSMQDNTTIFGIRAIIEAIESDATINKIYLQKGLRGRLYYKLIAQAQSVKA